MMHISLYERARIWLLAGWRNRAVSFKAVVYALVGRVGRDQGQSQHGMGSQKHAIINGGMNAPRWHRPGLQPRPCSRRE